MYEAEENKAPQGLSDEDKQYEAFLNETKNYFNQCFTDKGKRFNASITDFDAICKLGAGAFGKVVLVKHKKTQEFHAIKILKKTHIIKNKQIQHTLTEKRVLQSFAKHPFLMYLNYFGSGSGNLYFVLPYVQGGDLFNTLCKYKRFEEKVSRFFAAQVLMALEFMHYVDIIYRDLKPENILLDNSGYIKLTDFGFCKKLKSRTYTICGTPEYIAPEIVLMKGYGTSADWWSFGILIFEMTAGIVPFKDTGDHLKLYNTIVSGKFRMVPTFSRELKDLINGLLQVNITRRIGCLKLGVKDIKNHNWFKDANWWKILNKNEKPPLKPTIKDITSTYSETPLRITETEESELYENLFQDF